MKHASEGLSNSQFYPINDRRIIRIYLPAIDPLRHWPTAERGPRRNVTWITSLSSRNVLSSVGGNLSRRSPASRFDRVNHDILMGLIAKRVTDKRILKLIRGYLTAGVLEG